MPLQMAEETDRLMSDSTTSRKATVLRGAMLPFECGIFCFGTGEVTVYEKLQCLVQEAGQLKGVVNENKGTSEGGRSVMYLSVPGALHLPCLLGWKVR